MKLEIVNAKKSPPNSTEIRALAEMVLHPEIEKWDTDIHTQDPEEMYHVFEEFFNSLPQNENQHFLIAKVDGKVIGFLGIHRLSKLMAHIGEIGITVHPGYQGKGVGTRLMKAAVELARKEGFRRLEADTLANNAAMIRIAQKFGFQFEGIRKMRFLKDGRLQDEALMAVLL